MHDGKEPRREADVLEPEDLTDDQREALSMLAAYLLRIARKPSPTRPDDVWSTLIPIDRQRANHVFLLDGQRGSGKSAVLLTFLHCLAEVLRGRGPDPGYKLPPIERYSIVPVGLIDMQPMDRDTHLLLHLVGQLRRLVDVMKPGLPASEPQDARGLWNETAEPASVKAWRRFARAATAAWDGGGGERKKSLSPEQRALEVDQIEDRRRDLLSSFRGFVDALEADYRAWQRLDGDAPLVFVIAIDDADMNPHKVEELLLLVRTLWHPRVAFVLTGDSGLFESELRNELRRYRGDPHLTADDLGLRELARAIHEKIIPPAHRTPLRLLSWKARIGLLERLLSQADALDHGRVRLCALLSGDEVYGEAIPGRPRHVQDLAEALQRSAPEIPRLLDTWMNLVEEPDTVWYERELDPETGWLFIEGQRGWRLDWQRNIRFTRDENVRFVVARKIVPTSAYRDPAESEGKKGPQYRWEYRQADAVLLLAQAAAQDGASVGVELWPPSQGYWVRVVLQEPKLELRWRLPHWSDFEVTRRATRAWLNQMPAALGDIPALAATYLAEVLRVTDGIAEEFGIRDGEGRVRWEDLARGVAGLARRSDDPELVRWSQEDAALLAAPEFGLPVDAANAWLEAYRAAMAPVVEWNELGARILEARGKLVRGETMFSSNREALERLDTMYAEYTFVSELAIPAALESRHMSQELRRVFSNLHIEDIVSSQTSSVPLDRYLLSEPRSKALASLPTGLEPVLQEISQHFQRVDGSAPKAMHEIWTVVARFHDVNADLVRYEGERLHIAVDASFEMEEESRHDLGDGYSLQLHRAGPLRFSGEVERLPPPLKAIVLIAFDVMVDSLDDRDEDVGLSLPTTWPYLALRHEDQDAIQLPFPEWHAAIDQERFLDGWNDLLVALEATVLGEDSRTSRSAFLEILFWHLASMRNLFENRSAHPSVNIGRNPDEWYDLGIRFHEFRAGRSDRTGQLANSRRLRVFIDWLEHLEKLDWLRQLAPIDEEKIGKLIRGIEKGRAGDPSRV